VIKVESDESKLNEDEVKIVRTSSTFDCGGRCPFSVHVKNGKIIRIEGDNLVGEEDQLRTCLRCRAIRHHIYSPERILYPMKRDGPKGSGKYKRVSWDEALDEIADKMIQIKEKYGNGAFFTQLSGGYIGAFHSPPLAMIRLFYAYGGACIHHGNVSSEGAVWACMATYGPPTKPGTPPGSPFVGHGREDMSNSKLIVLLGWDPARMISGSDAIYNLIKAHEKGIKIISINPRYSDTDIACADDWIPIIPGTDTAMMAAWANVMIKENLHDQAFLDKYTHGFDKFKEYVMGQEDGIEKTPEWAEKICGIPAEKIREVAREYATTKPACLMDCQGPARSARGEQYIRMAITMSAMTGNIGKSGGSACGGLMGIPMAHMFFGPMVPPSQMNLVEINHPGKKRTGGSVNLQDRLITKVHSNKMFHAMLKGKSGGYPFDIKFLWAAGNDFLNQLGNINASIEGLKNLEYQVSNELFMTPQARYADMILPVTSVMERNDIGRPWPSGPYFVYMNKAIEPMGECKSDVEITELIAEKLGIENFKHLEDERVLRQFVRKTPDIKKHKVDYAKYKEDGIWRMPQDEPYVAFKKQIEEPELYPFNTPSGKIEIYSQRVADVGDPDLPPIPKYLSHWEDRFDPLYEKYPLQMISPHPKNRVHSELNEVDWLREVVPQRAWINPVDAEARGIKMGDEIYVWNDRGILATEAWVTKRIVTGAIAIPEGAWFTPDEKGIDRGGCPNTLTKDEYSPGGASALKTCLVQVGKESPR
jgi:anaerobic dimethyl sulfoxide reductase subunit A